MIQRIQIYLILVVNLKENKSTRTNSDAYTIASRQGQTVHLRANNGTTSIDGGNSTRIFVVHGNLIVDTVVFINGNSNTGRSSWTWTRTIQTNQLPAELASIATETTGNYAEESVLLCIRHYAEAELLIRKKTNALMMMVEKDVTDTASSTSNPPLGHTKYTWDAPPVLGRIDVRENKEGIREFYNIKTNEKFNPIGFNYISVGNRVPGIQKHAGSHTLFDVNGINGWEQHRAHAKKHLPI